MSGNCDFFLSGHIDGVAIREINCSTGKLLKISWNYDDLTLFLKVFHLKDKDWSRYFEKANLIKHWNQCYLSSWNL